MISFRFHLISLVAVFLALAIGIVVGSTLIDQTIVDSLRSRVEDVRSNLDERQATNDRLSEQVGRFEDFVDDAGPLAVEGRLDDTAAVIVTARGVDGDPVDRTVELLGQAGASVRGVLTLDAAWALDDEDTRASLAAALEMDPDDPVEELQAQAAALTVADLAAAELTDDEVSDDGSGLLSTVVDLQLADYEAIEEVSVEAPEQVAVVVVSGPGSELTGFDHSQVFAAAAAGEVGGVVLAEVYREEEGEDEGPERGDSLQSVLDDQDLSSAVTTVDDLDLAQGPLTVVLATATTIEGTVGHYGVGDGTERDAPLPPEAP